MEYVGGSVQEYRRSCNERRKFGSGKNAVTEMNVEGGRQRPKKKKKKK